MMRPWKRFGMVSGWNSSHFFHNSDITKQLWCTTCEAASDSTCRAPRFARAFGATCPGFNLDFRTRGRMIVGSVVKSQELLLF